MLRLILVGFIILVGLLVAAIKLLPWYWTVAVLILTPVLFILFLKWFGAKILAGLLSMPFKAKGAVLRQATAEIHQVTPAAPPEKKDEGETEESAPEEPDAPARQWYWLDVTITPQPAAGKFTMWEPGDLSLTRPEAKAAEQSDESCEIKLVQIYDGNEFKEDEGMKYTGPQYLRLHIGVLPGVPQLKFQYYFEEFGVVTIPGTPS